MINYLYLLKIKKKIKKIESLNSNPIKFNFYIYIYNSYTLNKIRNIFTFCLNLKKINFNTNFYIKSFLINLLLTKKLVLQSISTKYYIFNFIQTFLLNELNLSSYIKINKLNLKYSNDSVYMKNLINSFRKIFFFKSVHINFFEIVSVFLVMCYTKDLDLFKNWLLVIFKNLDYKLHKKFFYFFNFFISNYLFNYVKKFGISGFSLAIKGKIGVGGNSKKRRYYIRIGKLSLTNKSLKVSSSLILINAMNGQLGLKTYLSYI